MLKVISGCGTHCSTVSHQIPARRPRCTRRRRSPACCGSRERSCWLLSGTRRRLREEERDANDKPRPP